MTVAEGQWQDAVVDTPERAAARLVRSCPARGGRATVMTVYGGSDHGTSTVDSACAALPGAAAQLRAVPRTGEPWMARILRLAAATGSPGAGLEHSTRHVEWLCAATRSAATRSAATQSAATRTDPGPRTAGDVEIAALTETTRRFLMTMSRVPHRRVPRGAGDPAPVTPWPPPLAGATVAGRRALAMRALMSGLTLEEPPDAVASLARRALVGGPDTPLTTAFAARALQLCGESTEAGEAFVRRSSATRSPDDAVLVAFRARWRFETGGARIRTRARRGPR